MTIQQKIRDAIMGISKAEIEKTEHCTVPVRLEDGKTLTDKKWRNMSAWAGCKREEVVVYIDDTIAGSCKKGVVFTAETMWFRDTLSITKKEARKRFNPLRYDSVRSIHWDAQRSSYFTIQLEDTGIEVFASIFAKFYAEALKQTIEAAGTVPEQKKAPPQKRKKPAAEAVKPAEPKKPVEKKAARKPSAAEEMLSVPQAAPVPVSTPAALMTLSEVNARIAALEGELAELRVRADAERTRAEKAAAGKAAAKQAAAQPVQPTEKAGDRHLSRALQAHADGNMEEACRYFQLGAEAGNLFCMENLALIYSDGQLVPPDAEKAMYWFDQSWLHGSTAFQFEAAQLAIKVARTEADLKKAEEWVKRAEQDVTCLLDLDGDFSIDKLLAQIAEKRRALNAEANSDVFSNAEAEEGYHCPACLRLCKPTAGCVDHVCPYCGKVNRRTDLRKHKITQEDRINTIVEDLKLKIQIARGEVAFEPWDTNVPWNTDPETEELLRYGLDTLYTMMPEEGERALREAYRLGNMEAAYRLALLHLTEWHFEDFTDSEKDPVFGREAARAAAGMGHTGAIALCKVLRIPPEEKPALTREQQKKLDQIHERLGEIHGKHRSLIDQLKERYFFLETLRNAGIKEHEPLFMEWLELVKQGEQLDDPRCIRELYTTNWSLMTHGFTNETYYTSRMAELGNGCAIAQTGDNLSAGKGCAKDRKAAMQYYRVAADMDQYIGAAAITKYYYDENNKQGCLYWARKMVAHKEPGAYLYIAELSDDPAERAQAQAQMPEYLKKRKEVHP